MPSPSPTSRPRRLHAALLAAALAGAAVAALTGLAIARTLTLSSQTATVTDSHGGAREDIVVNSGRRAVYVLSGDSRRHPECTSANGCLHFWPPVTVTSAKALSKAGGVRGKLGTWRRNGLLQVTLDGHPLYTYSGDTRRLDAEGDGLHSFGGTWHIVKAHDARGGGQGTSTSGSQTMSSSATQTGTPAPTTPTSPYPGY